MIMVKDPDKQFIGKITVMFSTHFTLQCAVQAMLLLA